MGGGSGLTKKVKKRGVDFDFGKKLGKDEKLSPISKKSTHILKSASGKNKKWKSLISENYKKIKMLI